MLRQTDCTRLRLQYNNVISLCWSLSSWFLPLFWGFYELELLCSIKHLQKISILVSYGIFGIWFYGIWYYGIFSYDISKHSSISLATRIRCVAVRFLLQESGVNETKVGQDVVFMCISSWWPNRVLYPFIGASRMTRFTFYIDQLFTCCIIHSKRVIVIQPQFCW